MQHFLWLLVAVVFLTFVIDVSSVGYDRNVKALANVNKRNPDRSYFYDYYLNNGASGTLRDVHGERVYRVEGPYSYQQPNGKTLTVKDVLLPVVQPPTRPPGVSYSINPKAIASLVAG